MAHWAEIDKNNIVIRVTVGDNQDPDEGYQWLIDNLGGTWIKCSYNGKIRKNFPGAGYYYDSVNDYFVGPKPFESWILNKNTVIWQAPIKMPEDNNNYQWNEDSQSWDKIEVSE
jgi:hypothetical protein